MSQVKFKHYIIPGNAIKLVQISEGDAASIIALRNRPEINKYLSKSSVLSIYDQLSWFEGNKISAQYYWKIILKSDGSFIGTISLYNISDEEAEFGRYLCVNPIGALESVLLILEFGFKVLGLKRIYCKTAIENTKVWSQHVRFGFRKVAISQERGFELLEQEITFEMFDTFDYTVLRNLISRFQ